MKTHIVTLTVPLSAPTSPHQPLPVIQLLPDGAFSARDGRPGSLTDGALSVWTLSPAVASALLERWHGRTTPLVIDYEHQSLNTRQNGQPAPAAGWIESLGYTAGQGLFAGVRWTDNAVAFIEQDEYRYISPVFSFDPQTGVVLELKGAALTNTPALDGLATVATSEDFGDVLRAAPSAPDATDTRPQGQHPKTEMHMTLLERLKALLGLPETATEEDILAELDTLEALLASETISEDEPETSETSGMRDQSATKPATRKKNRRKTTACTLSDLLLGMLSGNHTDGTEHVALARDIETALADGRLTRGLLGWAQALGQRNPVALKKYLEASIPLAALTSSQTANRKELFGGMPNVSALSDEERFVCEQLGMKEDAYISQRQNHHQTRNQSRHQSYRQ